MEKYRWISRRAGPFSMSSREIYLGSEPGRTFVNSMPPPALTGARALRPEMGGRSSDCRRQIGLAGLRLVCLVGTSRWLG